MDPALRYARQITKSNNTQNTIKVSDFRSNDPVHLELVKQFSEIVRNGNRVTYPKRTAQIPTQGEIVKLEEFAKSFYARFCAIRPADRSAGAEVIADASEHASLRFLDIFTAKIRNPNTRAAYAVAVRAFFAWLDGKHVAPLAAVPGITSPPMSRFWAAATARRPSSSTSPRSECCSTG